VLQNAFDARSRMSQVNVVATKMACGNEKQHRATSGEEGQLAPCNNLTAEIGAGNSLRTSSIPSAPDVRMRSQSILPPQQKQLASHFQTARRPLQKLQASSIPEEMACV
jgi:hypothetical protein